MFQSLIVFSNTCNIFQFCIEITKFQSLIVFSNTDEKNCEFNKARWFQSLIVFSNTRLLQPSLRVHLRFNHL